MAAKKVLFNGIFKNILDFCGIRAGTLSDAANVADWCDESTVRAWRTRGVPEKFNLPVLLDALACVLRENPHMARRCESQRAVLLARLQPVWAEYRVPACPWDENKDAAGNLENILSAAYEASLGDEADVLPVSKPHSSAPVAHSAPAAHSVPAEHSVSAGQATGGRAPVKRVVAFDLDGTLIKGFRYSWTIVFKAVGKSEKEATKLLDDFEFNRISYEEWCEADLCALRAGGLTFEMVQSAVKDAGLRLTKNLVPAIQSLKENGCRVALISGGIDSVLKCILPEAEELFDEIFINRFVYDSETGILEKIIPTPYDWDKHGLGVEGKEAGFKLLCERYNVRPADSVFVGNDFNDLGALAIAGMKIYYYTSDERDSARGIGKRPDIRRLPHDVILEPVDDLMRVAKRVIAWSFMDMENAV